MKAAPLTPGYICVATALALAMVGCDGDRPDRVTDEPAAVDAWEALPQDFQDFYERFHADTTFQLSRITFPLDGRVITDTATGEPVEVRHARQDWVPHRVMDLGNDFVRDLEVVDDGLVFETIRAVAGNYFIERRFAEVGGEWNLIYYRETMGGAEG